MAGKLEAIVKENPTAHFFLDETFGINSELLEHLIQNLSHTSYFWIAFQNKQCKNPEEYKGTPITFCDGNFISINM